MIVAIDGPAGAGKSTVARNLAERLGFRYLDTGAMYRALTWLAMREGLPLAEPGPLGDLARRNPVVFDEAGRVSIAGSDVTAAIRQARIDRMVSVVARHHDVREVMRERQRSLGHQGNVVIEGRDRSRRRARRRVDLPPGGSRHPRPAPSVEAPVGATPRDRPPATSRPRADAAG